MTRRTFVFRTSGLVLTAWLSPLILRALTVSKSAMARIGMGTVIFRTRFAQTKPKDLPPAAHPPRDLTLLDVPDYYRDRFDVSLLEYWSYHFESLERGYLEKLRDKIRAAGSSLVNIQVDTDYNLASPDEAKRQASLAEAKRWIDAAAILGSRAIRINPGRGPVETSVASLREVNAYAKSKDLPLLTEDHFGIEMDPDVHLRLRAEAGPDNIYTLPDFGNYADDIRFAALEKILPYAWMISAKGCDFVEKPDGTLEHTTFDYDRCVRLAERIGFKGIYSVEQWTRQTPTVDFEKIADWLIAHTAANLRSSP
jgi:sugar phosphate isomerase/epimerase